MDETQPRPTISRAKYEQLFPPVTLEPGRRQSIPVRKPDDPDNALAWAVMRGEVDVEGSDA